MKSFIRAITYFTIYYSGFLYLSMKLLRLINQNQQIVILLYHRVHKFNEDCLLPSLHIKEFERQIRHIKKWYHVITLDQLIGLRIKGERKCISFIITFDDGYLNNKELAIPILRKYSVPATIYLTTGLMGDQKGLWVDEVEEAFRNTRREWLLWEEVLGNRPIPIGNSVEKEKAILEIYEKLLYVEHEEKAELIRNLFEELDPPREELKRNRKC